MTVVEIDRMMGYRLVSNQAIVRWVFSPENVDQFHVSDQPWEVNCIPTHLALQRIFSFCFFFLLEFCFYLSVDSGECT